MNIENRCPLMSVIMIVTLLCTYADGNRSGQFLYYFCRRLFRSCPWLRRYHFQSPWKQLDFCRTLSEKNPFGGNVQFGLCSDLYFACSIALNLAILCGTFMSRLGKISQNF